MTVKTKSLSFSIEKLRLFASSMQSANRQFVLRLVLCNFGGFAKGDRKKQSSNDASKDQNVSNGFHDLFLK